MASPRTFGGIGAGSALFWVDPERDLTFVCLTSGFLEETRSMDRFQRLSDLAIAAVVDLPIKASLHHFTGKLH